jgi:hypothetical protein
MHKQTNFFKIRGGILVTIGYLLSPASWWNDFFINIPLAYLFAFPFGLISKNLFMPFLIIGYWLTNIAGFMLMHYGVKNMTSKGKSPYSRKEIFRDILVSILYTLIVVILVEVGWLKFSTFTLFR